ncbi:hypothetical protein JOM56_007742, partial [Amanita muscaria]
KTMLQTLSYKPTGFLWSEDEAYPRTDLEHFVRWDTFETEINQAIATRMFAMDILSDAEYDIGSLPKKRPLVESEEAVRQEAKVQLHDLVVEMLDILGIEGRFSLSDSGNNQIVGEPDFSWLRAPTMHPKVVVEYKTKWAGPLEDLPAYFQRKAHKIVRERQSIGAVFQLYGYMTFDENKYGIQSMLGFSNASRLPKAKAKPCSTTGRSILMSIRFIRQVCSKPLWAPFSLPKLHLPVPPTGTLIHLAQLIVVDSRTIRSSWPDHIRFCHLTLVFVISTVLPCVMLRDEAVH